jgi:hypothetical protein
MLGMEKEQKEKNGGAAVKRIAHSEELVEAEIDVLYLV